MTVLELKTGLFPDADKVAAAMKTLQDGHTVAQADASQLAPEDREGWTRLARAILNAGRIVTL